MKTLLLGFAAALGVLNAVPSHASPISLNLGSYAVAATYALDREIAGLPPIAGLEASGVTYAKDRGTLFFVGDEGNGVVEISLTGQTLGGMTFNWANLPASTNHDTEALTYLGSGTLVVGEERLQNGYKFNYTAGGTLDVGNTPFVSFGPTIGNVGIEGISYDPRNSSFVTAKQDNPAQLSIFNSLAFSTLAAPDVLPDTQFSGASSVLGLNSLSDVQTLGILEALAGAAVADHILVLSLDSRKLIEIDRLGNTFGSLDLTGVLPNNAIEGVTIDENGTIYLVAEQVQPPGAAVPGVQSQLIVLKPVPEPATYSMMLIGVGVLGVVAHRRRRSAAAIR